MSDVVFRCSNCGTVQASTGECEACHEAQVRYFCTNHAPGKWLDGPSCPDCGARFGEDAPASSMRRSHPDRPGIQPTSRHVRPAPEPVDETAPWETTTSRLPRDGSPERLRIPSAGTLLEAFAYAARARRIRKAEADETLDLPVRASGSGCLGRLFLLAFLLATVFLLAPLLLGGALLRLL
ncbi:hypothetical protein [Sphingomonas aerophila]|uniref:Uncharacterized protein n=1 Tax=Sphingomonas aerophila TaxID=1344948 RepID=A0A7W9BGL8_9SPHN|nr:hypothetical protein [Sphingomonas aerophila]MBB5716501.1 hypothetical protein [Sphingomonas aerophila]